MDVFSNYSSFGLAPSWLKKVIKRKRILDKLYYYKSRKWDIVKVLQTGMKIMKKEF